MHGFGRLIRLAVRRADLGYLSSRDRAAAPIIAKYTGVLAAADVEVPLLPLSPSCSHSPRPRGPADRFTPDRNAPESALGCRYDICLSARTPCQTSDSSVARAPRWCRDASAER